MTNNVLKKIYISFGIFVILSTGVVGYTEVKIKASNNEKNLTELKKETSQDIKEIKKDQTKMLVKQGSMSADMTHVLKQQTRILTILEDLKRDAD